MNGKIKLKKKNICNIARSLSIYLFYTMVTAQSFYFSFSLTQHLIFSWSLYGNNFLGMNRATTYLNTQIFVLIKFFNFLSIAMAFFSISITMCIHTKKKTTLRPIKCNLRQSPTKKFHICKCFYITIVCCKCLPIFIII